MFLITLNMTGYRDATTFGKYSIFSFRTWTQLVVVCRLIFNVLTGLIYSRFLPFSCDLYVILWFVPPENAVWGKVMFLHLCVIVFKEGVSVQVGFCPCGLCPGGLYPGGLCLGGGGLCPGGGGLCLGGRGLCLLGVGESLSKEVILWGSVQGVSL